MNGDETIREKLLKSLTAMEVDSRHLTIEVARGTVVVRGAVPTEQQRERAIEALAGVKSIEIVVQSVPLGEREAGQGRSAASSTAIEVPPQSRRRIDRR